MFNLLKEELAAQKRKLTDSNLIDGEKKYFKRGDLVAQQKEEFWQRLGFSRSVGGQDYDGGNFGPAGSGKGRNKSREDEDDMAGVPELPRLEVIRRLREREEPILLYGESEQDAFKRLRRLEILEPEVNRGLRNDFQEALERVDQAYLNELLKTEGDDNSKDVKLISEELTMEGVQEMAKDLDSGGVEVACKVTLQFVQLILQMWGKNLNSRKEGDKMAVKGKMDSATYTQTQAYLKPLIKRLKKKTLPDDILECLTEIVVFCLQRDYVKANDAYLQMAIGNAPWPIGVTMVGIHARTGREKIFSKHVAHVLNDETQRKYIQGLKRLMTKCQSYFSADPSRCVEYKALQ
ncbi:pre-mRNA processing factor 18 [Oratosquilla oratoria]|uniref:pre-mRNA processing factor 18 n=1 Tax=Oratosquilla oratoria TaxID=337810 RepID=UPI003F7649DA